MNSKVTINPKLIIKCDFKHIFTYRLMYHILAYYDRHNNFLWLDKEDIQFRYNSNHHSVNNAVRELIDKEIIFVVEGRKNLYRINRKIFLSFAENDAFKDKK